MEQFDPLKMMDLDECVIRALELFERQRPPAININEYGKCLVVGSGNAVVTGKIIFLGTDAIIADESTYEGLLKKHDIKEAVIISASGGKHAPIIARKLKKMRIPAVLWTTNSNAPAMPLVRETKFFSKNPEPYTYNTSTYLGMILSKTKEKPEEIREFIEKEIRGNIPDLHKYDSYYIIVPEKFEALREMFLTKFDELFGSRISGRVFTPSQTMHAKTVVENEKECFISFGYKNTTSITHKCSNATIF